MGGICNSSKFNKKKKQTTEIYAVANVVKTNKEPTKKEEVIPESGIYYDIIFVLFFSFLWKKTKI